VGDVVDIVQKADQPTGKLTRGIVADILTSSSNHPRGIKVRLRDGRVGRVQEVIGTGSSEPPAGVGEPLFPKRQPLSRRY
jgi:uncharacterized repeat protein (TIGR03833 family)